MHFRLFGKIKTRSETISDVIVKQLKFVFTINIYYFLEIPSCLVPVSQRNVDFIEPEPICLKVPFSGLPVPTVTWIRCWNGKTISKAEERVKIESDASWNCLSVAPSSRENDVGTYKVTLENSVGKSECLFNVIVYCEFSLFNSFLFFTS